MPEAQPQADIGISAGIVDNSGKVVAARLFEHKAPFDPLDPPAAVAAFTRRSAGWRRTSWPGPAGVALTARGPGAQRA